MEYLDNFLYLVGRCELIFDIDIGNGDAETVKIKKRNGRELVIFCGKTIEFQEFLKEFNENGYKLMGGDCY